MNITAEAVKQLRERTGAGMMECKKALVETEGDLDAAAELMRKQGLAKADKKAARVAAEGVIVSSAPPTATRPPWSRSTARPTSSRASRTSAPSPQAVARLALAAGVRPTLEALLAGRARRRRDRRRAPPRAGRQDRREHQRAPLRRARRRRGMLGAYVHGTRIGALVALEGGDAALAHDLAMHVAASNPRYLSPCARCRPRSWPRSARSSPSRLAGEGKPPEIVAKMVEGRLRKSLGEITLLGQPFVKDPDTTVEKLLKGARRAGAALRALRGRRRHREEAGGLRRRGHGAGQGRRSGPAKH